MTAVPAGNSTRVLRAVVTSYIERGVPVGSAFLCRHSKMGLSPASVRSVMAELEAAGLLAKPHVSAGRVPTEAGYRVYVEHFMKPSGLSARETRAIRGVLDSPLPVADALRRMSQVLGSLSRVASVVVLRGRPGVGKARMDTYVCGVPNIVGKIGDWGTTIPLLSMLERREVLAGALLGAVADGEVTVTIGSRNRPEPLSN